MKQEKWLVWFLCAVLVVGAGIWYLTNNSTGSQVGSFTMESAATDHAGQTETTDSSQAGEALAESGEIAVYICGAISHPGVYRFAGNVRVCDVVDAAGGLKKQADSSAVNQARFVQDGEQIEIPTKRKSTSARQQGNADAQGSTDTLEGAGHSGSSDGKVNLNLATKEELMTLSGIGESKAEAIIAYREEHGSFQSPEDIMKISGIKNGVYQKIKDKVTV